MVNAWTLIAVSWASVALLMSMLWEVQRRLGKAAMVDAAWAAGIGAVSVLFAFFAEGDPLRRLLVGAMAGLWGGRLASHLLVRVLGEREDGRYRTLRHKWGTKANLKLFLFFQVQAFWAVLFSLPMLVASMNPHPVGPWDFAGMLVWAIALSGETLADIQLASFRKRPGTGGAVCQEGLWRYSRHPNYFFEWLHWWAYVLLGWSGPHGWLTLTGPILMILFLFKITGIPPTERQALASRGNAYRKYQRTTSIFVPWPPRR